MSHLGISLSLTTPNIKLSSGRFVILEFVPIFLSLEIGRKLFLKFLLKITFFLKLSIPLVFMISFVTVDEPPFLESLITLVNLEEESSFECSFLSLGLCKDFGRFPCSVPIRSSPSHFWTGSLSSHSKFLVPARQ